MSKKQITYRNDEEVPTPWVGEYGINKTRRKQTTYKNDEEIITDLSTLNAKKISKLKT